MNIQMRRVFVFAAICLLFSATHAAAQKKRARASKPAAKPPVETKAASKQTATAYQFSPLERAVLEEINAARLEPQKFVAYLEEYRRAMKGNLIRLPNRVPLRSVEGAPVIEEALAAMRAVADLKGLEMSERLTDAARMQLKDLQDDSTLGHTGKNGSTLKTRLALAPAVEGKAGENISYRSRFGRDIALLFLIDDGVASRSHRKNVLNPAFNKLGVACGSGKNNEMLCVTVFAGDSKPSKTSLGVIEF